MKPKNILRNGTRVRTTKNPFGSPVVTQVTNVYHSKDVVTASALLKGNHKKPMAHAFTVQSTKYLSGSLHVVNATNAGYWERTTGELISYGNSIDAYFPLPASTSTVYNAAVSDLYENLRGSIDLSVDIATFGQTTKMAKELATLETYTKNFRSIRALIKGIASARLMYVYGIKPTVSTIYECVETLKRSVDEELCVVEGQASEGIIVPRDVTITDYMSSSYQDPKHVVSTSRGSAHKVRIKCRYRPIDNSIATFTSLNPASIIWESMPYSFVVDWLFNIGNYIRDLETSLLYRNQFIDGYMSKLSYCEYSMRPKAFAYQKGSGTGLVNCRYDAISSARRINFARTILTASPSPALPSFRADLGSARLLNAAALLANFLKK